MKILTILLTLAALVVSSDLMAQIDPLPNSGKQGSPFRTKPKSNPPQTEPGSSPKQGSSSRRDPKLGSSTKEGSDSRQAPEQGSSTKQGSGSRQAPEQGSSTKQGSGSRQAPEQGSSTKQGSGSKQGSSSKPGSSSKQMGESEPPTTGPAYKKYLANRVRWVQIDDEIGSVYSNLTIGIRPEQNAQMAQIKKLENEKAGLSLVIFDSAVEAFRESGPVSQLLVRDVAAYASACLGGNNFPFPVNPPKALEIGEMMIGKEYDLAAIRSLAMQAAYHVQDFDTLFKHLDKFEEMSDEPVAEYRELMQTAAEAWLREQELRQNSANLPMAVIETNVGTFKIELFEDHAPGLVANFVSLVDSGFYNGNQFFESRRGEFCRTGSPENQIAGNAGYWVANEAKNENARKNFTYSVSMLPFGDDHRHSSQFIISQRPLLERDGTFSVFGRVIEGTEVILKIQPPIAGPDGRLSEAVRIKNVEIINRRPGSKYVPKKLAEVAEAAGQ